MCGGNATPHKLKLSIIVNIDLYMQIVNFTCHAGAHIYSKTLI